MDKILQRFTENPLKEIGRWVRIPLLTYFGYLLFVGLSDQYSGEFSGWLVTMKLNILSCLFALLVSYIGDRCLAHGDRAHELTGMEMQVRNGIRLISFAIICLALSGG